MTTHFYKIGTSEISKFEKVVPSRGPIQHCQQNAFCFGNAVILGQNFDNVRSSTPTELGLGQKEKQEG